MSVHGGDLSKSVRMASTFKVKKLLVKITKSFFLWFFLFLLANLARGVLMNTGWGRTGGRLLDAEELALDPATLLLGLLAVQERHHVVVLHVRVPADGHTAVEAGRRRVGGQPLLPLGEDVGLASLDDGVVAAHELRLLGDRVAILEEDGVADDEAPRVAEGHAVFPPEAHRDDELRAVRGVAEARGGLHLGPRGTRRLCGEGVRRAVDVAHAVHREDQHRSLVPVGELSQTRLASRKDGLRVRNSGGARLAVHDLHLATLTQLCGSGGGSGGRGASSRSRSRSRGHSESG